MMFKVLVLALLIGATVAQKRKTWIIGTGHDWGAHEYFDQSGYIRGFSVELIAAVCQEAGIDCRTMWIPSQWCWNSEPGLHSYGGQGIVDGWVDGSIGWFQTIERIHVFDFSLPYLTPVPSYFFVKPGKKNRLDTSDLSGKKIVFVKGWQADEKCLARHQSDTRQNYILSTEQMIYVTTVEDMVEKVLNGEADAAFNGYTGMSGYVADGTLNYIDSFPAQCALTSSCMMTRKDNGLNALWNIGFQKLRASGKFAQLCKDAQDRHDEKGTILCLL